MIVIQTITPAYYSRTSYCLSLVVIATDALWTAFLLDDYLELVHWTGIVYITWYSFNR